MRPFTADYVLLSSDFICFNFNNLVYDVPCELGHKGNVLDLEHTAATAAIATATTTATTATIMATTTSVATVPISAATAIVTPTAAVMERKKL